MPDHFVRIHLGENKRCIEVDRAVAFFDGSDEGGATAMGTCKC